MAVRYICCDCNYDMTNEVKAACAEPSVETPALVHFKGMQVHASRTVILTCPKGHQCTFPCVGGSDD
jgi:hypothetical protein